jgi:nucleotide-binding universal stress UspA family protein
MLNKILVALDRSTASRTVLQNALVLAQATQAQLLLLHVLSPEDQGSPGLEALTGAGYYQMLETENIKLYQQRWQAYVDESLAELQAAADEANQMGIPTEMKQLSGQPGQMISQEAEDWGAELIVLGRRGHSGLSELILGSVSNYVVHHAHCSVFIVQLLQAEKSSS